MAGTSPAMTASPKNALAPVLGGGRFTQPGADGGERLTRHQIGAADNTGRRRRALQATHRSSPPRS